MRKKIALLLLPFVIFGLFSIFQARAESASAQYYGGLIVDTGVTHDGPLFTDFDFKPGDCKERTIKVKNTTNSEKKLTVRSTNVEETGNLSEALTMTISQNGNILYDESLKKFFEDSMSLDGIILGKVAAGQTKFYKFKVCFNIEAGNEYQKKTVEFDLIFGDRISPIELPEECSQLTGIITSVINGSDGNDRINGTSASELILGLGGNDRIDGGSGDDCIVDGDGNNRIEGGSGNDIIISGNGNNKVDGGAGQDKIYSGDGNDRIDGGSGNDLIYSGPGNDEIKGESGNDYLNGGPDHDKINGNTGIDQCVDGEILSNCEM